MKKFTGIICALLCLGGTLFAADSVPVIDEQFIAYDKIPAEITYTGSVAAGHKFTLYLGEERDTSKLWQIISYNSLLCHVGIEHERSGFWFFATDKAEIEIKPRFGTQTVVVQCGEKKVTIVVRAL